MGAAKPGRDTWWAGISPGKVDQPPVASLGVEPVTAVLSVGN
ncbi:MAG: hypothetical protein WBI44_00270 [Syntrophaceticus sp.]